MVMLLQVVGYLISLVAFICYIIVVIKLFTNDDTTWGIICAVGFFVCFIGVLLAFIRGWMKSGEFNLQPIMLTWTGCIVAGIVVNILTMAVANG